MTVRLVRCVGVLLLCPFVGRAEGAPPPRLDQPFARIQLSDGRVLTHVELKAFNATSVFVRGDGGILQVPYDLFPPELQPLLAQARAAEKRADQPEASPPRAPPPADRRGGESVEAIKAEREAAVQRVIAIVNQPVTQLARQPGMQVAEYKPGWFHPGAIKPDFNTVDVRATQTSSYSRFEYVTSDLNPGVVFLGHELAFNPMTKYFYTDRSLPKKKLTEEELLEVNRLYRVIGRCDQRLATLNVQGP